MNLTPPRLTWLRRCAILLALLAGSFAPAFADEEVPAEVPPPPPPPAPEAPAPVQQVRIEVRVLEWQLDNGFDFDFVVGYKQNQTDFKKYFFPTGSDIPKGALLPDSMLLNDGTYHTILADGVNTILTPEGVATNRLLPVHNPLVPAAGLLPLPPAAIFGGIDAELPAPQGGVIRSGDLTLPARTRLSSSARLFLDEMDVGAGTFEAMIETLESVGEVRVLSQPSIVVTVGTETGKVSSGQKVPYASVKAFGTTLSTTTEYRDTGVTLECSAKQIKYEQFVHMTVDFSVTDQTSRINIGSSDGEALLVPVLASRGLINEVMVRDRTVFIAGLLKTTQERERRQGIPWISELPILRKLTTNVATDHNTAEIVFLIRPEILDPVETSP